MDENLKKRLVGAAVLASLAVIFVPMLVDKRVQPPEIKPLPKLQEPRPVEFKSSLLKQEIPAPIPVPKRKSLPEPVQEPVTTAAPQPVQEPAVTTASEPKRDPISTLAQNTTSTSVPERAELQTSPANQESVKPPPARVALGSWVVRVGSFGSRDNAQRLVQKLRAAGLDTMAPEPVEVRGKTLYRVMVGPEIDRERAIALLPKIKKVSQLQGQVYAYP